MLNTRFHNNKGKVKDKECISKACDELNEVNGNYINKLMYTQATVSERYPR